MFKSFITLIRGHSHDAAQSVVDNNAMTILRQQLRDSAEAVTAARKAIAIATSQNGQEETETKKLIERIEDLEGRTIEALEQGKQDLAREAAETIAILEAEKETSLAAQHRFKEEIERLKQILRQSETRLRDLKRGQRLADATDKTQRLRQSTPNSGLSAITDAEATLARLNDRQREIDATANALDELVVGSDPDNLSQKLADAGCGKPIKTTADQILERLSDRANSQNENNS